jgi:branched-subunit amino acid transport protein
MSEQTLQEILLLLGMFVATFISRYPILVLVGRIELPQPLFRALRYVPVAVLTAIIVPAALMPTGTLNLRPQNAFFVASIIAILISWRTRNLLATIVGGMAFFFLWRAILP